MMPQYLLALPSFVGALISLGLAGYTLKAPVVQGRPYVVLCGLATAIWCLGQFLWLMHDAPEWRLAVAKFQYIGISSLPPLWFLAGAMFSGRNQLLRSPWLPLVCCIPAITVLLALSNEWHGLIWAQWLDPTSTIAQIEYGPWFLVHLFYSYTLLTLGSIMILMHLAASPHYRLPFFAILAASLIVVLANLTYLSGTQIFPMDITPSALAIAFPAIAWVATRHRLLQLVPVARSKTLEQLQDGLLVASGNPRRVVDANPAVIRLLDLQTENGVAELIGRPLAELIPAEALSIAVNDQDDIETESARTLEVRRFAVSTSQGTQEGDILLLRDVTKAREAETRLLQTQARLAEANRKLETLAATDELTGLDNRRRLTARLNEEIARCRRSGAALTVVLADLDNFKQINDSRGHAVGDSVLITCGRALRELMRQEDLAARFGGEEFALVFMDSDRDRARQAAWRLQQKLSEIKHIDKNANNETFQVTWSMGLASLEHDTDDIESILKRADDALYHAKEKGRNSIHYHSNGNVIPLKA